MYIVEIYNLISISDNVHFWYQQLNSWYKKWTVTSENVIVDPKNSYPAKE